MSKRLLLGLMSLVMVVACSEKEKLDDMHDATNDMRDITNELYDTLRQGDSLSLRRQAYEAILKAPTLFKKISEANKYFMSFEFQIWNKFGQDLETDKRALLGQQAAMEFFMEIEELAPADGSVNPLVEPKADDIYSDDNRSAAFNALAVSMHQHNRKQVRALSQSPEQKPMSMYSMMEEALLATRDQAQTGYVREVLAHESKAIQLLQARYNVFPLVFINAVSHIGNKNFLAQAWQVKMGWTFDVETLNATQLEYLQTEVLNQALAAKKLLEKLNIKPELNSHVEELLTKMTVKKSEKKSAKTASQEQLLKVLEQLKPSK